MYKTDEAMYSILVDCPLFRGLDPDKIKEMIEERGDYTIATYGDGELIASKDCAYSGLMIILSGRVHGEMISSSGHKAKIDLLEAPQLIAPAFLFGGYNKLPVDIISDGDTTILTLHRGYLFELMQDNMLILSNFIDIISDRANIWSKKIFYLSFRSLKEKIASYLLENTTEQEPSVAMPGSTVISQLFDATRSAVGTVLTELEKKRLITSDGSKITVTNRTALSNTLK